jgi:hypothetical protein
MAPQKKNKSFLASLLKSKSGQRWQRQQASAGFAQVKADVSLTSSNTSYEQQSLDTFFLDQVK